MAITNSFRNAVAEGDVKSIRIMMKDSLLVDLTFTEFNDMERCVQNVHGLYDTHDGRALEDDPSAWNDDYMSKMMVQAVGNFSHERIEHLQKIVRHLNPVTSLPQARVSSGGSAGVNNNRNNISNSTYREPYNGSSRTSAPAPSYQQQKFLDKRNNRIRTTSVVTGAVAGGVVGGTIVTVAGGSFIAGAAVGAVVVGAAVYVATNGR